MAGRVAFLVLDGAVLLLNALGLPANWILLGLALLYSLLTHGQRLGWGALAILAALAVLGELLELLVGVGYVARRGATRWGAVGAFLGGILGAVVCAPAAPPLGSLAGGFGGSLVGAVLFEYVVQRRADAAWRAGRAAFLGKVLGVVAKILCGFWMWCVLAYRLLLAR